MRLTKNILSRLIKRELRQLSESMHDDAWNDTELMGKEIEDLSDESLVHDSIPMSIDSPEHRAIIGMSDAAERHISSLTGGDTSREAIIDALVQTYGMDRDLAREWALWSFKD